MSSEDKVYQQARSLKGPELHDFLSGVLSLLQSGERGKDFVKVLRQLYVLLHATRKNLKYPDGLIEQLHVVLFEPDQGSPLIRLLCSTILRELSPRPNVIVPPFVPPVDLKQTAFVLPLLTVQGVRFGSIDSHMVQIITWITEVGSDSERCLRSLSWLAQFYPQRPELLSSEQYKAVSQRMADWLRTASTNSALNPFAGRALFSGSGQVMPVKEIDGTVARDFFTVLTIGHYYSSDQLLNIQSFSMLRRWLKQGSEFEPCRRRVSSRCPSVSHSRSPSVDIKSSGDDHSDATSGEGGLVNPALLLGLIPRTSYQLKDKAVEYCLRIIDQCERKPTKPLDEELLQASLYEAIVTLDELCTLDKSLVPRLFPPVKKLFARMGGNYTSYHARILMAVLLFFLDHGEVVVYDSQPACTALFSTVVSARYADSSVSFDIMHFCLSNATKLRTSTNAFKRYFPNLFKIFAWSPRTYLMNFAELLPHFISPDTALEVLHSLCDLPCLSAALEAQNRVTVVDKRVAEYGQQSGIGVSAVTAAQQQQHMPLLWFIMRSEGGHGDTINRLGQLHSILEDMSSHPRVQYCADSVPVLVKIFFKTVLAQGDYSVISRVLPVMMERLGLLYTIPSFQKELRRIIADELLLMFKAFPSLIVDHASDITEFTASLRNMMDGKEHYFVHLIWIIGEYTASQYDSRCTTELLVKYHESLECVAYELSQTLQSAGSGKQLGANTTRLMSVLMTALAKVASRCQDLIPRVLLCLTKIVKQHEESQVDQASRQVMLSRASELVNILKMPSLAATILSAITEDFDTARNQSLEKDREMAVLLQATCSLLQQ
ncbi:AP-5 complex subunit zeta-1-like [Corticium candelabrum]|uniref:AP-5 complex subunit zeta-1-like n=1 Tax=Corticium candelabrum TaxID=121492 RepID=UPI002E32A0B2|nr:AP-5 complex subunit zeta-1-like [Corticium candelabrum]